MIARVAVVAIFAFCCFGLTTEAANPRVISRVTEPKHFRAPPHLHSKFAYVTYSKEKGYDIKIFAANLAATNGLDWVAKARYQNLVNKTGWAFVEVESKPTYPDEMQAFAAGMAEGYLTRDLIYAHWRNTLETFCEDKQKTCTVIDKYISKNIAWMLKSTKTLKSQNSYWYHVSLLLEQIDGVYAGYQKASNGTDLSKLTKKDLIYLNLAEEFGDLEAALNPDPLKDPTDKEGHCSVLIKVLKNNRDLYASHVTWSRYTSMLRVIKRYNLSFNVSSTDNTPVPAREISFSSYPGVLQSIDDWYVTSSGLMVTETTNENYNTDLWSKVKPTDTLFTGIRAVLATRLATDGKSWSGIFSRYNSGTYNNQWMIVNYNVFEPTKPIQGDVLWVLEQLPGMTVSRDVSDVLRTQGYWASYNIPYFDEIYQASGHPKMVDQYGDFFSYKNTARAQIFARDHDKARDVDSMVELMRYNDFKNDPLSRCNCTPPYSAENAISARNDLNLLNGTYPIKMLGHRSSGATDVKMTNLDLLLLQQFVAISGPTYDPLPPFRWSTSDFKNLPHYGQPDEFKFEPVIHQWKWL